MKTTAIVYAIALIAVGAPTAALAAPAIPSLGGLAYRSIGPAISGGRTTAVVGSDVDPQVYYAGGADGGVFKSTDGGLSWSPIFDRADAAAIGAIAIAPRNPDDVWVGTGESNPRNDVEEGDGIWHSRDGGKTWTHLGLDDAGSISSISLDPRDPSRAVVGVLGHIFRDSAARGVYVTRDAGAHWTRALYVGPSTGVSDLARLPDHPDTLFAGLYPLRRTPWTMISGGDTGGIYRSDDGGSTWRRLAGEGLPGEPSGRVGLSAGTDGRVYAIIQSRSGDLWRSDDGGTSWHLMPHSWLVGDRRFYFSSVTLDPADPDKVIDVGLILSMSTDSGRTFHKIATNVGWDYHRVWWSADGRRIAVGSDEGAIMSSDGGKTWWQPYDLPFAQPYHVGFDDALPNYDVCIGLQDDDSWCGPSNGDTGIGVLNREWFTMATGDGMWAEYDPVDPHLIWSTSTNSDTGQVFLWDSRTQQSYEVSPDAENTGGLSARVLRYRFNWDTPISFTTDGKALVGGDVVFESADHGQHWTAISPDLTRDDVAHEGTPGGPIDADMSGAETNGSLLDVAPSRVDGGVIWTGSDDGLVHVTRDGGGHWADVTPPGAPRFGRVPTVEPGRFEAGTAFAVYDDHMLGDDAPHVYATGDFGKTWSSISGDLPRDEFARVVRQDPTNASLLYAGTSRGVFASWDSGAHWQSLRLNMPASDVYDLEVQPRADDLLVATHGRGVWVLDDLRPLQMMRSSSPFAVTLFPVRDTYRWWQWPIVNAFDGNTALPSNDFVGKNVPFGALITYGLPSGSARSATIEIVDSSGRVVRHLQGHSVPTAAGLNRASWDLNEDGPHKWLGTIPSAQGPAEGAEVVPGAYTVRLDVDGTIKEQPVVVEEDPRDSQTPAQMASRHDALEALLSELGGVDDMLTDIDHRLRTASGSQAAALLAFQRRLTYLPRNAEDLGGPAGLRDRLNDLIGRIQGTSYQPPTQAQSDEASVLKQMYDAASAAFKQLPT